MSEIIITYNNKKYQLINDGSIPIDTCSKCILYNPCKCKDSIFLQKIESIHCSGLYEYWIELKEENEMHKVPDNPNFVSEILSIEAALDSASKYIAKKDCPRVIMDNQPWDCNTVCNEIGNESWKCWKQYFLNLHK